jgi:hypothetical protein
LPFFHLLSIRDILLLEVISRLKTRTFFEAFPTPGSPDLRFGQKLAAIKAEDPNHDVIRDFAFNKSSSPTGIHDNMMV